MRLILAAAVLIALVAACGESRFPTAPITSVIVVVTATPEPTAVTTPTPETTATPTAMPVPTATPSEPAVAPTVPPIPPLVPPSPQPTATPVLPTATPQPFTDADIRASFRRALRMWGIEKESLIRLEVYDYVDDAPCEPEPGLVPAACFRSFTAGRQNLRGKIHFIRNREARGQEWLHHTLVHEVGHAMGLDHNDDRLSVVCRNTPEMRADAELRCTRPTEPSSRDYAEALQILASEPTATPEPPTATPEPPTATPEPPTATPEPRNIIAEGKGSKKLQQLDLPLGHATLRVSWENNSHTTYHAQEGYLRGYLRILICDLSYVPGGLRKDFCWGRPISGVLTTTGIRYSDYEGSWSFSVNVGEWADAYSFEIQVGSTADWEVEILG